MLATLHGLPVGAAPTGAKAHERQVMFDILTTDPTLTAQRSGQTVIRGQELLGADFEAALADTGLALLRPARKGGPGARFFRPLRQTIESIFDTYKGQLDLEHHGGKTPTSLLVRILQRIPAALWHNDHTGQPIKRSLLAYDH